MEDMHRARYEEKLWSFHAPSEHHSLSELPHVHQPKRSILHAPSATKLSLFSSLDPNFFKEFAYILLFHLLPHFPFSSQSSPWLWYHHAYQLLSQATSNQRQMMLIKLVPQGPSLTWAPLSVGIIECFRWGGCNQEAFLVQWLKKSQWGKGTGNSKYSSIWGDFPSHSK